MNYLLDTNICIYLIKNKYKAIVQKMENVGIDRVFLSSITIAELEYGIAKSSKPLQAEEKLYEFLIPFTTIDFDHNAARQFGNLKVHLQRQGKIIGPMDLLIASIGLANNLTIVTNNIKEFERVPNLLLENWIDSQN